MIAGFSWAWWAGFHAVVAVVLVADSLLPGHRHESRYAQTFVWLGYWDWRWRQPDLPAGLPSRRAGRWRSNSWPATPLRPRSASTIFLFFWSCFEGFQISRQRQHKALSWGIWGAFVLRALFIAAGVTLLQRFDWIAWIFGLFLLYAAWRLVRSGSTRAAIPAWIVRLQPAKGSLLPVILAVEVTDLLFATDSIPAVLSVTHNPFVAYTSNVAAVLGLRSLYFALAALLDRFRYLHYGLGALLAFAALKMLAARWVDVPITLSLAVIGAILGVCAVVSAASRQDNKSADQRA